MFAGKAFRDAAESVALIDFLPLCKQTIRA